MEYLTKDMRRCAAWLAHLYKTQPSELNKMTQDVMQDWMEQSEYIGKQIKKYNK